MNINANISYFNELLAAHEVQLRQYKDELQSLPEGSLRVRPGRKENEVYYMHAAKGKVTGISGNAELKEALARKKFLQKAINLIEGNIKCLKQLTGTYRNIDEESIISSLPEYFGKLINESFVRWQNEKISWMTDEYDQSTFNLWEKSHVTARGLHVRSKSEVIVAERLDYYRIPYRYEQVIYIDRYRFAPDFTILTKKGLMYWEHCGLMDDPEYARKQSWKNFMYAKAGIVPWRNYITTYDDEAGNFNSKIIESEIINKILPYC